MQQLLTTVPAHFDGQEIKLDVPVTLETNSRLLVIILDQPGVQPDWLQAAMKAAEPAFAQIWDNAEDAIYDDLRLGSLHRLQP
ncbi:MAG: hypothetical protein R6X34_03100 [Chloroflexota bacterium]